jgi:hypothetical protein
MPPHKEKIKLTPHFFITQSILRLCVSQGFYIIPKVKSIDDSSLIKFRKFLTISKNTIGIEQSNDIQTIYTFLKTLHQVVKKAYTDIIKVNQSFSSSKPQFKWNYLGSSHEKALYFSYLQKEMWNLVSTESFTKKVGNTAGFMENPWSIIQFGEYSDEPFSLPGDLFGEISIKHTEEISQQLKSWDFSPFIFVHEAGSLQWEVSVGKSVLASGYIIENDLTTKHIFTVFDLT